MSAPGGGHVTRLLENLTRSLVNTWGIFLMLPPGRSTNMSEKRSSLRRRAQSLRVGDNVSFTFAGQKRIARIIEDRGHIGRGGRRLLRIAYDGVGGGFKQVF